MTTTAKLIRALEQAGFVTVRTKGSHRIMRRDDPRARVTVPMHSGDIPRGTLHAILRDAGLRREDL